ncbi:Dipeptidyl aminopeptidase-like protein 6, partial [Fragariocoptes setiger]
MEFEHKVGALDDEDLVVGEKEERNWKGIVIALVVISSICSLIILSIVILTPNGDTDNHRVKLELDPIIGDHYKVNRFNGSWISSSDFFYVNQDGSIAVFDAVANKTKAVLVKTSDKTLHTMAGFRLSADRKLILFVSDVKHELGQPEFGRYAIFNISSQTVEFLDDFVKAVYPNKNARIQHAQWSPKSQAIVMVDNNDIYYIPDLANHDRLVRLTKSGESGLIFNGIGDYLYHQNIFTDPNYDLIRWSSDGSQLAFLSFDDGKVEASPIEYYDSYVAEANINPKVYYKLYPRAGFQNPSVSVNILRLPTSEQLENRQTSEPINVRPPAEVLQQQDLDPRMTYYVNYIDWIPNSNQIYVIWTSRAQNSSILCLCKAPQDKPGDWHCDPVTTFNQRVPSMTNTKDRILVHNGLTVKSRMTFVVTPRPDYLIGDRNHIGMFKVDEKFIKFLTFGDFDVERLLMYDERTDTLYFEAASTRLPERHLYRVNSVVQGDSPDRRVECLTCSINDTICGYNHAHISPDGKYLIHECLGPSVPIIYLRALPSLSVVSVLDRNDHLEFLTRNKQLPKERLIVLKTDGRLPYDVHMKMYLPSELEEEHDKKFPVLIQSSDLDERQVWSRFEIDWGKYLASRKQLVYIKVDCIRRSTPATAPESASDTSLGTLPVFNSRDQVEVIRYLLEAYDDFPFLDRKRIAIWGATSTASYAALATAADDDTKAIQCTIAVAPIINWKYLDSFTAEHYLGLMWTNDHNIIYEKANLLKRGYDFVTRRLLISHGTADEWVHVQHSMQFIKALTEHHVIGGVVHQMQLYPDADHSLDGVKQHLYRTMDGFLDRCFYQKPITIRATEWKGKSRQRV